MIQQVQLWDCQRASCNHIEPLILRVFPMIWWWSKLFLGVALIVHSVAGNLGYIGFMPQLSIWVPLSLILVGGLANLYHYYLIKRSNPDISRPEVLIRQGGLFRFSRHPMYFCDLLVYAGLAMYPLSTISMMLYGMAVVAILWLAEAEDELMRQRFGDCFDGWSKKSRLLLPIPK